MEELFLLFKLLDHLVLDLGYLAREFLFELLSLAFLMLVFEDLSFELVRLLEEEVCLISATHAEIVMLLGDIGETGVRDQYLSL